MVPIKVNLKREANRNDLVIERIEARWGSEDSEKACDEDAVEGEGEEKADRFESKFE